MESISTNYKKVSDIQEDLRNVTIENNFKFNYQGDYEFKKCEYCDGLLLGLMAQKCPKLDYDEKVVKKFKSYLKTIGGFREAIERTVIGRKELNVVNIR